MNETKKSGLAGKIAIVAAAVACVLVYLLVPGVNSFINKVLVMFRTGDFSAMRAFIA